MYSQCYNTWMGWGIWEGRRGNPTKRPRIARNTTQVRYSKVALSKIRLHYMPYFQSIFSWCGFVTNFCFLPKYMNPLFALDVNNVGRMLAMARPITWLGADGETEPNILSFPTCLSLSKDILFISYLCRRIPHSMKILYINIFFFMLDSSEACMMSEKLCLQWNDFKETITASSVWEETRTLLMSPW